MEYGYVALTDQPRHGLHWDELVAEGWCEWMKIPFWTRPDRCGPRPGYVYIMRRPKDEPHKDEDARVDEWYRLYHERYGVEPPTCFFLPRLDEPRNRTKEGLMVVQEIESTDLGRILEKVKSAKALCLPFTLTAEVQTKKLGQNSYRSLLYTLWIKPTLRRAVSLTVGGSWLVKE